MNFLFYYKVSLAMRALLFIIGGIIGFIFSSISLNNYDKSISADPYGPFDKWLLTSLLTSLFLSLMCVLASMISLISSLFQIIPVYSLLIFPAIVAFIVFLSRGILIASKHKNGPRPIAPSGNQEQDLNVIMTHLGNNGNTIDYELAITSEIRKIYADWDSPLSVAEFNSALNKQTTTTGKAIIWAMAYLGINSYAPPEAAGYLSAWLALLQKKTNITETDFGKIKTYYNLTLKKYFISEISKAKNNMSRDNLNKKWPYYRQSSKSIPYEEGERFYNDTNVISLTKFAELSKELVFSLDSTILIPNLPTFNQLRAAYTSSNPSIDSLMQITAQSFIDYLNQIPDISILI